MTTTSPSLQEFLRVAQQAFDYLRSDYGFSRCLSGDNPYSVQFSRDQTSILVEGINWGFGVNILLSHEGERAPLWAFAIAKGCYEPPASGQLEQLRQYAVLLKTAAETILRGDASAFPAALSAMSEASAEASKPKPRTLP